jgi:hypothetical protein
MGGRGSFASGVNAPYTYETVGKIDGVKVLQPIDKTKSFKLPEEAHSSTSYVLLDKNGVFHQYREYNANHEVMLEIGYHQDSRLGHNKTLHVHIHTAPGVENHKTAKTYVLTPSDPLYKKYFKFFKGVK